MSQKTPPGFEPRFIEIGDADDMPLPLPIFVTRQDRSHDEAMREALRVDPTYAAELRAALNADGATDELAVLDRYIAGTRKLS